MKTKTLKLVYFSPTGTTKSVVQEIGAAIDSNKTIHIDITTPTNRQQQLQTSPTDLMVVGVPVYMGRVPDLVTGWLKSIKAANTPSIAVVVYGNRAYENALLELSDILTACGCKVIAGAAFIGEHSFSCAKFPCSSGRPDTGDLEFAKEFGRKINEAIHYSVSTEEIRIPQLPGTFPYGGVTKLWDVDFIEVNEACTQCGVCAEICPAGAINNSKSNIIDIEKCITCCACIKKCPQNARTKKPGLVRDAAIRINSLYSERKQPEIFIINNNICEN